jgi:hypothetical protein
VRHRSKREPSDMEVGDDRADKEHGDAAGARRARRLSAARLPHV